MAGDEDTGVSNPYRYSKTRIERTIRAHRGRVSNPYRYSKTRQAQIWTTNRYWFQILIGILKQAHLP